MDIIKATADNFDEKVLKSDKPVIVDFWASWCGPCQMMAKVIDAIAEERDDIAVAKVNVDEESALAQKYRVTSIPMIALFEGGVLKETSVGFMDKESLIKALGL
jgi:thioredoxin 1